MANIETYIQNLQASNDPTTIKNLIISAFNALNGEGLQTLTDIRTEVNKLLGESSNITAMKNLAVSEISSTFDTKKTAAENAAASINTSASTGLSQISTAVTNGKTELVNKKEELKEELDAAYDLDAVSDLIGHDKSVTTIKGSEFGWQSGVWTTSGTITNNAMMRMTEHWIPPTGTEIITVTPPLSHMTTSIIEYYNGTKKRLVAGTDCEGTAGRTDIFATGALYGTFSFEPKTGATYRITIAGNELYHWDAEQDYSNTPHDYTTDTEFLDQIKISYGKKSTGVYTHFNEINRKIEHLEEITEVKPLPVLRILCIGNSHTRLACPMLHRVLMSTGRYSDVVIGRITRDAQELSVHYDKATTSAMNTVYEFKKNYESGVTFTNRTIEDFVTKYDWDMIILQEQTDAAGVYSKCQIAKQFTEWLIERCPNAQIGYIQLFPRMDDYTGTNWKSTYTTSANMWEQIKTTSKSICNYIGKCKLIPVGQMVQYARKDAIMNSLYTGFLGDSLHLAPGIPRFAYCCVIAYVLGIKPDEITFIPTSDMDSEITVEGTEYLCDLAKHLALTAYSVHVDLTTV